VAKSGQAASSNTNMATGTMVFTDTLVTIQGSAITITDITTSHSMPVMVPTLTPGFANLHMETGSISGSAFDAAQAVRMMPAPDFPFCREEVVCSPLSL